MLANPPFNDSDWHRSDEDVRWKYGLPPKGNASFAWVQHFIHQMSPSSFNGQVRVANRPILFELASKTTKSRVSKDATVSTDIN